MPAERLQLSTVRPERPADTDYDAICAAVAATARGRWFLDEYAKRNRNSDTLQVLAAIARMETAVVGERAQQASREAHQEVRIELLEMARAIAQARAEVAESTPSPSQPLAAEPAGAAAPDVAAAAERLRQIAWTMRACGVEVVASDQIGQIAETILSADALRSLGEQRAQKLTAALHYLEHRIDRMLDSHMAAANAADATPAAETAAPQPQRHAPDTGLAAVAVAMVAAAMQADSAATAEPETGPIPSAALAQAAAATLSRDAARAAPDATEYPMDDDVVLTVTDSAVEPAPAPAPAMAPEPGPTVERLEREPIAEIIEPELPAPTDADARESRVERIELEHEPLMPATPSTAAEAAFAGLELEPLAIVPAPRPQAELHAAVTSDEPAALVTVATGDVAEEPPAQTQPAPAALAAPVPATDTVADDDQPLTLATDAMATGLPDQPAAAAPETAAAATIAEPADAPRPPAAATAADPIAMQVDQDLYGLTDVAADQGAGDAATRRAASASEEQVVYPQLVHTTAAPEQDPAELLLETPPQQAPVSALVASSQASRAQLSDTLAAIESELFGSTRPEAHGDAPAPTTIPPAAAKAAPTPAANGPLAALMAMSEEERIAMFS